MAKIEWVTPEELTTALQALKAEILAAVGSAPPAPTPSPSGGYAKIGPAQYGKLQDAANAVTPGATIEIYGEMRDLNASAVFQQSCTIRGMTADAKLNWTVGRGERMAWDKGLIVCAGTGQNYTIEDLELTGARNSDGTGAGIRADETGGEFVVRNCYIHDNENGVLAGAALQRYFRNRIENNGNDSGTAHGIYAALPQVVDLWIQDNTFGPARVGNQIKSRAKRTYITHNVIAELDGACSWQIDLANGGDALIQNNVIEQGPNALNRYMISYAPEGFPADDRVNNLIIRDNILIQDHADGGWGIQLIQPPVVLQLARNAWVGNFVQHVVNGPLDPNEIIFADRAAAGYEAYPFLPALPAA